MSGNGNARSRLERALDLPERVLLKLPLEADGRMVVRGLFGFLKQILRSRGMKARPTRSSASGAACALLAWLASAVVAQAQASPELLESVGRSVVRLSMGDGAGERGNGTGFVVREDGVVVTNHHVVSDRRSQYVAVFKDGTRRKVLGSLALDEAHDLALIRIERGRYPALRLAPANAITTGQPVLLIGSSVGLDQSLGAGIVSALRPAGFPEEWRKHYREAGLKVVEGPIVQHTASSAPGSSGAPLVDLEGRVVAVHHSGVVGFPMFFGAHADALRALLARTDLEAPATAFGPNVVRNLLISAAFFAALAALLFGPGLLKRQPRGSAGGWKR
jgi:hypothetical protein